MAWALCPRKRQCAGSVFGCTPSSHRSCQPPVSPADKLPRSHGVQRICARAAIRLQRELRRCGVTQCRRVLRHIRWPVRGQRLPRPMRWLGGAEFGRAALGSRHVWPRPVCLAGAAKPSLWAECRQDWLCAGVRRGARRDGAGAVQGMARGTMLLNHISAGLHAQVCSQPRGDCGPCGPTTSQWEIDPVAFTSSSGSLLRSAVDAGTQCLAVGPAPPPPRVDIQLQARFGGVRWRGVSLVHATPTLRRCGRSRSRTGRSPRSR